MSKVTAFFDAMRSAFPELSNSWRVRRWRHQPRAIERTMTLSSTPELDGKRSNEAPIASAFDRWTFHLGVEGSPVKYRSCKSLRTAEISRLTSGMKTHGENQQRNPCAPWNEEFG